MSAALVSANLAAAINAEHDQAYGKAREALEHARRCGELLLDAKAAVAHGEWLPWLSANCSFSVRTAQGYMLLARDWDKLAAKYATAAYLTMSDALELISPATQTRQANEQAREAQFRKPFEGMLPEGVHFGDFRELARQIPDESVDLVFTDSPYSEKAVPLYADAARIAARILKPNGSMIAYTGQKYLPEVLSAMSPYLRYWWTCAGIHEGGNQLLEKLGVRCGWKPLVWFVKGTRGEVKQIMLDIVRGDREKDAHEWQQSVSEAVYFIDQLSPESGCVVDFFVVGGTTCAAAVQLNRRFVGFEIDENAMNSAADRWGRA